MLFCAQDRIHFNQDRCCQCGACLAVCPHRALTRTWRVNGVFVIHCDAERCVLCRECVRVCPAVSLPDLKLTEDDWDDLRQAHLGHSVDERVRFNASSGGVARTLIGNVLEKGVCERAYTVVESEAYPWAMGGYLTRGSNYECIANSKYLPIPACENLEPLPSGRLLVVGTHCQLLAMEAFYRYTEVKMIKVCILCKQQKTLDFSKFVAQRLAVSDHNKAPIQYRGEGWPGYTAMGDKKIPYEIVAALPFGKRLWRVAGCRFCAFPLGSSADLTLADPWKINTTERSGTTLILVRTEQGQELLDLCREETELRDITIDQAKLSIDWQGIEEKQERTEYYLGKAVRLHRLVKFRIGELQRKLYEKLLLSVKFPEIALKVLNKLPYWG